MVPKGGVADVCAEFFSLLSMERLSGVSRVHRHGSEDPQRNFFLNFVIGYWIMDISKRSIEILTMNIFGFSNN